METTFTLGESSEDVLENVCFMVLKIKKRRANTKIGPPGQSLPGGHVGIPQGIQEK